MLPYGFIVHSLKEVKRAMRNKSTVGHGQESGFPQSRTKEYEFQAMAETETGAGWRIIGKVKPQRLH